MVAYLIRSECDMMIHAVENGQRLASVSYQEMAKCKAIGDSPEMTFARALAVRRLGCKSIAEAQKMLSIDGD